MATIPLTIDPAFGPEAIAIVTARPWVTAALISPPAMPSLSVSKMKGSMRGDFCRVSIGFVYAGDRAEWGRDAWTFHCNHESRVAGHYDYGFLGAFNTLPQALEIVTRHLDGFQPARRLEVVK